MRKSAILISVLTGYLVLVWSPNGKANGRMGWIFLLDKLDEARVSTVNADHVQRSLFKLSFSKELVLFTHPPSHLEFKVKIRPGMRFSSDIALNPVVWDGEGDGVVFRILVRWGLKKQVVMERYIDPRSNASERRAVPVEVDLSRWDGERITLVLETSCGPAGNCVNDWAGWIEPTLTYLADSGVAKPKYRNVVLIVADTLRADVLGCYGHPFIKTPHIDALAERGWLFERCISQSSTTVPSHVSLFTSSYMKDHGIYDQETIFHDAWQTLPEVFRRHGFNTAAVVSSSAVHASLGFGQGFNFYSSIPPVYPYERDSADTNNVVFDWLENNHEKPFFLWVHYFDNHGPYDAPQPFKDEYYGGNDPRDPDNRSMEPLNITANPLQIFNRDFYKGITDMEYIRARYFGEVSYLDKSVGEVIARLEELGHKDDTLIVFTADHGESLTEHNLYFTHVGLYEQVLKIPLIVAGPNPARIKTKVELIDLYPTILDIMDLPIPEELRGKSLATLADSPAESSEAVSEHTGGYMLSSEVGRYKYIIYLKDIDFLPISKRKRGDVEMYDMVADPEELINIAEENPNEVEEFRKWSDRWLEEKLHPDHAPNKRYEDERHRQMLKNLGYIK